MTPDDETWPTEEVVGPFRGEYHFLSNFSEHAVRWRSELAPTAEHAYQAAKAYAMGQRQEYKNIIQAPDPVRAKIYGRKLDLNVQWWDEHKDAYMLEIVTAKFAQNPELQQKLVATLGDGLIVELNDWGDEYWGADVETGEGKNKLGRILMNLRTSFHDLEYDV